MVNLNFQYAWKVLLEIEYLPNSEVLGITLVHIKGGMTKPQHLNLKYPTY